MLIIKKNPQIRHLTFMITEKCNLNCWMCDFGMNKTQAAVNPVTKEWLIQLLQHPLYASSLRSLTFTGGEPFTYPAMEEMYCALQAAFPNLRINFSTNATLLNAIIKILKLVKDWKKIRMLVSIDGLKAHDQQRGQAGLFQLTYNNLERLRKDFPELNIVLKFTISHINFTEIYDTCHFFLAQDYNMTVKWIENNPHYNNKTNSDYMERALQFNKETLNSIRSQLQRVLADFENLKQKWPISYFQIEETCASLNPRWKRRGRCYCPEASSFIDSKLNFYSCKEYEPVLNLRETDLVKICDTKLYKQIISNQKGNRNQCRRCISHMKLYK